MSKILLPSGAIAGNFPPMRGRADEVVNGFSRDICAPSIPPLPLIQVGIVSRQQFNALTRTTRAACAKTVKSIREQFRAESLTIRIDYTVVPKGIRIHGWLLAHKGKTKVLAPDGDLIAATRGLLRQ